MDELIFFWGGMIFLIFPMDEMNVVSSHEICF